MQDRELEREENQVQAESSPGKGSKQIVICIDGTNNDPLHDRTNVSRFFRMLKKIPEEQIVYYQAGVGTLCQPDPGLSPGQKYSILIFLRIKTKLSTPP